MTEYRPLDITIVSASDLPKVNLLSPIHPYVVLSLSGVNYTTHPDKHGNRNPVWNFPMKFTVDEVAAQQGRLSLFFQIRSRGSLIGDKLIGEVHVPIKDLLSTAGRGGENKAAQIVSYQVRKPSGKAKGVLNFSFKFGDKFSGQGQYPLSQPPSVMYPPPNKAEEPVLAYPATMAAGASAAYPPPLHHGYGGGPYPPPPPAGPGYGYGYGQAPAVAPSQRPPRRNKMGMGLGAGLLGGALAGMVLGDLASDVAYDNGGFGDGGFDGGFGDGGFDFGGF